MTSHLSTRTRWLALVILCVGDLMIVVDTTVVNVALPSIRNDLGFSQTSLAWVVNAYMLTFGGLLLLAGRLGDLFGHRRLFLIGTTAFTTASLVCGISTTKGMLIAARAVQGVGGAVVSAVAFSLIVVLFTEPAERAKAMGVFGFVMSGGGSIGVLAGGVLDRPRRLALDLPRQPADRDRRHDRRPEAAARRAHRRRADAARRGGRGRDHRSDGARRLRDRQRQHGRLARRPDTRPARRRRLDRGRVRRLGVARAGAADAARASSVTGTCRSPTSSASSGLRRCSPCSSSRRSTCSSCSTTAR